MRILAADPGLVGAVALYEPGVEIILADLPTYWEGTARRIHGRLLLEWVQRQRPDIAFVENVWAIHGAAAGANFRFGRAAGAIESAIQCAGVRLRLVAPITWKNHYGLLPPRRARGEPKPPSLPISEIKEKSRLLALKMFPEAADMLARRLDHGRADAALLAAYGAHVLSSEATNGESDAAASGHVS